MNYSYFLGTSSPKGFVNCFFPFNDKLSYTYILKGGPGTGKSSLMKKIVSVMEKNDIDCEIYRCSSDPASLDAVSIPSLKINIVDGTAPHTLDPDYPGINSEIINLGDCWDREKLTENRNNIISASDKNRNEHAKAKKLISSAFMLYSDCEKICSDCVDKEKIIRFASRFAAGRIKRLSSKIGIENKKLLTAITPDGCLFLNDTVNKICDEKIILKDDFGIASAVFLSEIKNYAVAGGFNVLTGFYPENDKNCHFIIIKELSLGIFTENLFFKPGISPAKVINMRRFYDGNILREHKSRLGFIRKACAELIDEACLTLTAAKNSHDEIEKYYIKAMNFDRLDEITETLCKRIWASEWYPNE